MDPPVSVLAEPSTLATSLATLDSVLAPRLEADIAAVLPVTRLTGAAVAAATTMATPTVVAAVSTATTPTGVAAATAAATAATAAAAAVAMVGTTLRTASQGRTRLHPRRRLGSVMDPSVPVHAETVTSATSLENLDFVLAPRLHVVIAPPVTKLAVTAVEAAAITAAPVTVVAAVVAEVAEVAKAAAVVVATAVEAAEAAAAVEAAGGGTVTVAAAAVAALRTVSQERTRPHPRCRLGSVVGPPLPVLAVASMVEI